MKKDEEIRLTGWEIALLLFLAALAILIPIAISDTVRRHNDGDLYGLVARARPTYESKIRPYSREQAPENSYEMLVCYGPTCADDYKMLDCTGEFCPPVGKVCLITYEDGDIVDWSCEGE